MIIIKKKLVIGSLVFLLIIGVIVLWTYILLPVISIGSPKVFSTNYIPRESREISKDDLLSDAKQIISIVEDSHPAFSLNEVDNRYSKAKDKLLKECNKSMTVGKFRHLLMEYLTSLKDGHTMIDVNQETKSLDKQWSASGDNLYLLDEKGNTTGEVITHIGKIPVKSIFDTIDTYYPFENEAAQNKNHRVWSSINWILEKSGVETKKDTLDITIKNGKSTFVQAASYSTRIPMDYLSSEGIATYDRLGGISYIDLNVCEEGRELDEVVKELQDDVAKGASKVIIDVRDNPGGNSDACKRLLEAMNMSTPRYGMYVRLSPLAKEQRAYIREIGSYTAKPKNNGKPNEKISLIVLTNENTFSSATMLGVWVQDGKLGKVMGQASSNSPSAYGDILKYQLNNSGIIGSVSHKKFLRPNENANPKTLEPDIKVPFSQDSLKEAINYLNSVK